MTDSNKLVELVEAVQSKDYLGFTEKAGELMEERIIAMLEKAKDEITSKAKVDDQENSEEDKKDEEESDKE